MGNANELGTGDDDASPRAGDEEVRLLESCAFRAWPAEEAQPFNGWWLRAMRGVTRRANSVWTFGSPLGGAELSTARVGHDVRQEDDARSLETAIAAVEAFYEQRQLRPRFQMSPASSPAELDGALARRGYVTEAPVSVQTAATELVCGRTPPTEGVTAEPTLSDAWFALSGHGGRFQGAEATYRGLLERLGDRAIYALAVREGAPVSVALGVIDGEYCGVFSMLTARSSRRAGLGTAVLAALARSAAARGARTLYLQVELENNAARALYGRLGFRERYRYDYRVKER